MTEESFEIFAKGAKEKYGDKVNVNYIHVSDVVLKQYNDAYKCNLTALDFENYGEQVWLTNNDKCPECDSDLLGLFGCFEWGVQHGVGECGYCHKVLFRYYHYIGGQRIMLLALEGF